MFRQMWPMTLVVTLYSLAISGLDAKYHLETLQLPVGVATLPGAFVGMLLAFRTNSSYGRWWEARTIWGRIVNDSRSLVRQLLAFTSDQDDPQASKRVHQIAHRQIAWCHVLTRSLRKEDPLCDVAKLLSAEELKSLVPQHNVPNAILLKHAEDLRGLRESGAIDTWQFVALENTLTRLTDSMGGCERIRNTPFPPLYSKWIHSLIYLLICLLPFALVHMPALGLIFVTVSIAVGFLIVEKVAMYLETPFSDGMSCTPMSTLSNTIEINIRQMIGDSDLPQKMQPTNGVFR